MKNVAIVGAGLGGLSVGALLAKRGFKVTILEQHNILGGCATVFKRGKFSCEVGLHEMDGLYTDKIKKEVFEFLDVYKNIEFVESEEFFRVKSKNIDFTMPNKKDEAIKELSQKFPDEKEQILKYFELIEAISKDYEKLQNLKWWQILLFPFIFKNITKYKNNSVKDVMNSLFKNEELKMILNTNVAYYHDKIENFSFLFHSIAQNSYFGGGSWFIKGGSQKLSDYLASIITQNGGEVITKADVIKINYENKNIKSIIYKCKNSEIELKSDIFISNLSPISTYNLANIAYKESKTISSSYFVVYFGFNKNLKKLYGKKAYSQFFLKDVTTIDEYDKQSLSETKNRSFVFVDYSQIDSQLCDDEYSYGSICTSDYLQNWENLSQDEYQAKKDEILNSYLDELEKEYPNLREYIKFSEVGTPKTIQRYIKTPNGTSNGFAPTKEQFFRMPEVKSKKIDNLYFVGAWVLGGGFSSAIISAKMCGERVLGDVNIS